MKRSILNVFSILVVLGMLLSACATPTAQTIIQTVEVEKPVIQTQVVKETQVVQGNLDCHCQGNSDC